MLFICSATALADVPTPYASDYISACRASISKGDSSGDVAITFNITAYKTPTSIGASKIVIYKSNGTQVKTITGSTSNGLLWSSGKNGMYTHSGTSGTSYYAEVTFIAKNASGSDTRTMTTSMVTAP